MSFFKCDTHEQTCDKIRQFARGFIWEDFDTRNPEKAAYKAVAQLGLAGDLQGLSREEISLLESCLEESAEKTI